MPSELRSNTREVRALIASSVKSKRRFRASKGSSELGVGSYPGFSSKDIPDLTGKVAIVTGASAGLGFESVLQLAKHNCHVICIVRNEKKGQEALRKVRQKSENDKIELEVADLADLDAIKSFAEKFVARGLPLHILMNNAGITATKFNCTKDGFEMQWQTNHLAHFYLTLLLLPVLQKTATADTPVAIHNVSSIGAFAPYPKDQGGVLEIDDQVNPEIYHPMCAYGQSKLAQIAFTRELAHRLGPKSNVTVTVCHPGTLIRTEIARKSDYSCFFAHIVDLYSWCFGPSIEKGALTQLYLSTYPLFPELMTEHPIPNGSMFDYICQLKEIRPNSLAGSEEIRKRVWCISIEQLKSRGLLIADVPESPDGDGLARVLSKKSFKMSRINSLMNGA
ncbi:NAD(P)-binding protein [Gonapodya prolifera JEL478]|uniref:NAD(P)-binding protein n=1 Tax=Gonapodya prolifera (strain JEL478) TaxID=1344416 RepID=A0A139AVE9_GONPJ|nr:NAD(P)-binding protein [Gonapodya prolifera JEL478]|eukprot:KXS20716.1 NAD(P)-binding protein [Gonapodya prolifera JEL478]